MEIDIDMWIGIGIEIMKEIGIEIKKRNGKRRDNIPYFLKNPWLWRGGSVNEVAIS